MGESNGIDIALKARDEAIELLGEAIESAPDLLSKATGCGPANKRIFR